MKKFKKYIIYLLIFCILTSTKYLVSAAITKASIEITEGIGPTYPVDPDNPNKEIEEEIPTTGALAILSVSDFDFGSIEATGKKGLYDITTTRPNIQTIDFRGNGSGWSVSATATSFISKGEPSLKGSVIHIYNSRPNSLVSGIYAPTQEPDIELTMDSEPVKILSAKEGTGMGLWVMRWYPPEGETTAYIKLEIPAGASIVGTHSATINWTLKDTP